MTMGSKAGRSVAVAALLATAAPMVAQPNAAPTPPATSAPVTFQAPMRDGVMLEGDVFLPQGPGPFPLIIEVTPYGRGPDAMNFRYEAPYWNERGYAFAVVDVRGTGGSGGTFGWLDTEAFDGHDLVGWLASQPWSNARIAMRGSSYTGANQWQVARTRPPALKCLNPNATVAHPFMDLPYRGGAFGLGWALNWVNNTLHKVAPADQARPNMESWIGHTPLNSMDRYAIGIEMPLFQNFLAHETLDSRWRRLQLSDADYRAIDIPALAFSGWFDGTLPGTITNFKRAHTLSPAHDSQFLVVGPYTHSNAADGGIDFQTGLPTKQVGAVTIAPNAILPGLQMTTEFFDWCLKGAAKPQWPAARIYVTGSNQWLHLPAYPVSDARLLSLYLSAAAPANGSAGGGYLSPGRRHDGRDHDSLVHDPAKPVLDRLPNGENTGLPVDIRALHERPDVLVYTSDPLDKPLTVVGTVTLDVHLSSSAKDTDILFQLMDVGPDGTAIRLGPQPAAQLRARFRHGFETPVLLEPGKPVRLHVDLSDIGHSFQPGHRIRIAILSSLFPWIDINRGTGNPIATDTAPAVIATNRIWHTPARPSRLILPVLDRPQAHGERQENQGRSAAR